MTYKGRVQGGVVVLEPGVTLPDGTEVQVEPLGAPAEGNRLHEGLLRLAGTVTGLPPDMAENHDHYIHGTPAK